MSQQTAPAPPGATSTTTTEPPPLAVSPRSAPAQLAPPSPFHSRRARLDRIGTVRPDTAVAVFAATVRPVLKSAGALLLPAWAPFSGTVEVMVVNLAPVDLVVAVEQLLTLDGEDLHRVVLDVRVRLDESRLVRLLSEHGDGLGTWLGDEVRRTVEGSVRAAVGMNRGEHLRRRTLEQVLDERWLPLALADGALRLESWTVREVSWVRPGRDDADREGSDDEQTLTDLPVVGPALRVGSLGRDGWERFSRSPAEALEYVHVPAVLSVVVFWVFFVAYWVPELSSLPGARFVLDQLAPLASKELISGSQALVGSQVDRLGLPAAYLFLAALVLPLLARSRWWPARLALWPVTYLGLVGALATVIGVAVRGRIGPELVGCVLLVVWVAAAVVTTWRSLWVDVDELPRRPTQVLWLLALFTLVIPLPVAVGRAVVAPQLRTAAVSLLDNGLTLRWAALLTPVTALAYLCGLALGVLGWAAYVLWPTRGASPDRRRWAPVATLVVAILALATLAPPTGTVAARRAATIATGSPAEELSLACGSWTESQSGGPTLTLAVVGVGCRHLAAFRGYDEVSTRNAGPAVSPVLANAEDGSRIDHKLVSGHYQGVVVLAASDRADKHADILLGLRLADTAEQWRFACAPGRSLKLRFAATSTGDDAGAARRTLAGETPAVQVDCGTGAVRLDPATGRPLGTR